MQVVVCHVEGRDSSAIKFDRDKFAFISAFFPLAEPLDDEGVHHRGGSNSTCSPPVDPPLERSYTWSDTACVPCSSALPCGSQSVRTPFSVPFNLSHKDATALSRAHHHLDIERSLTTLVFLCL